MFELVIAKGPHSLGKKIELHAGKSYIIGRDDSCSLAIKDKGVSKRHCELSLDEDGNITVKDLNSSNGTFINGSLTKMGTLKKSDVLSIHDFVFQLVEINQTIALEDYLKSKKRSEAKTKLYQVSQPNNFVRAKHKIRHPSRTEVPIETIATSKNNKLSDWLGRNIYPIADSLGQALDVRILVVGVLLVWSIMLAVLSIHPFQEKANGAINNQALEVANLYARQLVRLNQVAIINERHGDLITQLDTRPGQTPGLLEAIILDATQGRILAPTELLGRSPRNSFEAGAYKIERPMHEVADDGTIYSAYPIKIGTSEGNKIAAVALVKMAPSPLTFSAIDLIDEASTALVVALIFGIVLFMLAYRWINGSLSIIVSKIDTAMMHSSTQISCEVKWPALKSLCEQVSFALGRAQQARKDPATDDELSSDWAIASVMNTPVAAAALNESLEIVAWNEPMENLTGTASKQALGAELTKAIRDLSLENAILELTGEAMNTPWMPRKKTFNMANDELRANVVFGQGHYFITISGKGEVWSPSKAVGGSS